MKHIKQLTEQELEQAKRLSKLAGMSVSDWIEFTLKSIIYRYAEDITMPFNAAKKKGGK